MLYAIETKKGEHLLALWVGKLPASRRYNQLPLLRSGPGGFARSWPYRTYPYSCNISISIKGTLTLVFCFAKVLIFFHNARIMPNLFKHVFQKLFQI